MNPRWLAATLLLVSVSLARADGPADNLPDKVRPVPPLGIPVPDQERARLQAGVEELGKSIDLLREKHKDKPALLELLPDVQIFQNSVRYALAYNEFYKPDEFRVAAEHLRLGLERAGQLLQGNAPWEHDTGLVVRGYLSRIDGSVQPYGLVVPESYGADRARKRRLDIWFHGRGENLTELSFLEGRRKSRGDFTPADAFVLHPYGRYCNANKFAGEIDTFEALEHIRKHYAIDDNRVAVRGFSMGGAACWQFAVHYPGLWAAAAPGAGFSETADFLKVFQSEKVQPTWYEQKLWHVYDCTDYAINLYNCPTVAYSGEKDRQKQAADMMEKALAEEGLTLVHIIGPSAQHFYEPKAKEEVARRIDALVERGRNPAPARVRFTTWTLRYNEALWLRVDGLEHHWDRARVDAEILGGRNEVKVATQNVTALTLDMPPGRCPLEETKRPTVVLDGKSVEAPPVGSDRSWTAHFRKTNDGWAVAGDDDGLRKRHGLQGPIDDAFLDSFLMVRPTGKPLNETVGKWADAEMKHAVEHWRRQFRGEARIKDDADVTEADIAAHNLVLWGDPSSNRLLAKIADRLPIRWDAETVKVGDKTYPAGQHVPVLIYPNPLNPKKYVVLNSGFTYREYDYLNNARQVPKLPDWAVVDVSVPVSSRAPGGIANAGFFGEKWEMLPPGK